LVNIEQRYGQEYSVSFFDSRCIYVRLQLYSIWTALKACEVTCIRRQIPTRLIVHQSHSI